MKRQRIEVSDESDESDSEDELLSTLVRQMHIVLKMKDTYFHLPHQCRLPHVVRTRPGVGECELTVPDALRRTRIIVAVPPSFYHVHDATDFMPMNQRELYECGDTFSSEEPFVVRDLTRVPGHYRLMVWLPQRTLGPVRWLAGLYQVLWYKLGVDRSARTYARTPVDLERERRGDWSIVNSPYGLVASE